MPPAFVILAPHQRCSPEPDEEEPPNDLPAPIEVPESGVDAIAFEPIEA